jgi:hypothetical protein
MKSVTFNHATFSYTPPVDNSWGAKVLNAFAMLLFAACQKTFLILHSKPTETVKELHFTLVTRYEGQGEGDPYEYSFSVLDCGQVVFSVRDAVHEIMAHGGTPIHIDPVLEVTADITGASIKRSMRDVPYAKLKQWTEMIGQFDDQFMNDDDRPEWMEDAYSLIPSKVLENLGKIRELLDLCYAFDE